MEANGKWHVGILRISSKYPITNQPLKYPPTYFKSASASAPASTPSTDNAAEAANASEVNADSTDNSAATASVIRAIRGASADMPEASATTGTMVVARADREAKKDDQFSFKKGHH